jgi:hypothetical protein
MYDVVVAGDLGIERLSANPENAAYAAKPKILLSSFGFG